MSKRQDIVAEAMSWLGTPYHHHASQKGLGVDCVHLLCAVYEACGVMPPFDPGHYPVDWHMHRSEEPDLQGLEKQGVVRTGAPHVGDVAIFRFGRTFSHAGVYVARNQIIHAYKGAGVILTRISEEPLRGRICQSYSIEGLLS
jgi:NlpC/P60 family putative phage cell wall peptidase